MAVSIFSILNFSLTLKCLSSSLSSSIITKLVKESWTKNGIDTPWFFVGFSRHLLTEWTHILFLIIAASSLLNVRHTVPKMIILKYSSERVTPLLKIFHWLFRAFKTKSNMIFRPLCLNVQSLHYKNASEPPDGAHWSLLFQYCFLYSFPHLFLTCPVPLKISWRTCLQVPSQTLHAHAQ